MVIENFSLLSNEELKQFAEGLLDKINKENTFSKEYTFKFVNGPDAIWADTLTGDLVLGLETTETVSVSVNASWQAPADDVYDTDSGIDEESPDFGEVFTSKAEIDGYQVILEVTDYDREEQLDIEVEDSWIEDSGIGHYEYWGFEGDDSNEYAAVVGYVTNAYSVYVNLYISPAETNK